MKKFDDVVEFFLLGFGGGLALRDENGAGLRSVGVLLMALVWCLHVWRRIEVLRNSTEVMRLASSHGNSSARRPGPDRR